MKNKPTLTKADITEYAHKAITAQGFKMSVRRVGRAVDCYMSLAAWFIAREQPPYFYVYALHTYRYRKGAELQVKISRARIGLYRNPVLPVKFMAEMARVLDERRPHLTKLVYWAVYNFFRDVLGKPEMCVEVRGLGTFFAEEKNTPKFKPCAELAAEVRRRDKQQQHIRTVFDDVNHWG